MTASGANKALRSSTLMWMPQICTDQRLTMRGLQSETFAYYVHIYTNDVCWNKISANVKIYQASTGGLLRSIQQPDCSESKSFFFVSHRGSEKIPGGTPGDLW